MLQARAVLDLAEALDAELEAARRHPRCSPTSSCRWSTCSPTWSSTGIAVDIDHLEALEAHFAGEVQARGRRRRTT